MKWPKFTCVKCGKQCTNIDYIQLLPDFVLGLVEMPNGAYLFFTDDNSESKVETQGNHICLGCKEELNQDLYYSRVRMLVDEFNEKLEQINKDFRKED